MGIDFSFKDLINFLFCDVFILIFILLYPFSLLSKDLILLNIGNNIPFIFLEFVLVFFNDKKAPLFCFLQSHTLTYPNFFDNSTGIGLPT